MRDIRRPRNRPAAQGLASTRPLLHARHVETGEQRRRLLGALVRTRRKAASISSAKKLAELTGNAVGTRTIEAVEAGERVISSSNYSVLEVTLHLPIGIMEDVLRGKVKEFPPLGERPSEAAAAAEERYTKSEIRAVYRALGTKGFEDWVFGVTPAEGGVRTVG